ncbi:MAG: biosynthetic arginine decarboxylase [Thermoplasmatota archaeon]
MARLSAREAEELYQVEGWSGGYFRIGGRGTLQVCPEGLDGPRADLLDIVESLREDEFGPPVVMRFPQILADRVGRINQAFQKALVDNDCQVRYRGVFPIKVNQRKDVVQALARSGRKHAYGLEVGSKAELVAALTMDPNRKSLLIVNGFKDKAFLEAACHATHFKDEVIIVLDELGELPHLIPLLKDLPNPPIIGLRLKLRSKAPGKWALSGGERSKFGLTIPEVLWAVEELRKADLLDRLQMLHFHIGSQISHIRRIAQGVREAARIYTELRRMGVPLRLLDCGGGQAIDYDGSASSSHNSCNYTMEEYAGTVVATVKDVCEEAEIPMPDLISESGRAVVAHHAVLVMNVMRRVPYLEPEPDMAARSDDDPTPLWNLYDVFEGLTAKNAFESFHDTVQARDDLLTLFDLGHLSIQDLARAESLTRALFARIRELLERAEETESEEYVHVQSLLSQKLVCNFSLFQSVPDVWGVKQQFPVLPIHRLREAPSEVATLADITCDSDGEIRQFIDAMGTRPELPVHAFRSGERYYLAVPLVGAYQDALGDYHNLFGETNEAWVTVDDDGWNAEKTGHGSRVSDMLRWVDYDPKDLARRIKKRVQRLKDNGRIDAATAKELEGRYRRLIDGRTYLDVNP